MVRHTLNIEASKGGAAEALALIILKAWIPRAQTIPMVVFSNLKGDLKRKFLLMLTKGPVD